jgi:cytidylate kinase
MTRTIDDIIDRQLRRWEMEREILARARTSHEPVPPAQPVVTVSRQHGSSGATLAARLADRFRYTLLHRDVLNRMCESMGCARRLLEALDERSRSQVAAWFGGILEGRFLDEEDYARALFRTIASVAQLGGVVVVGRGANFIVGLDRGFHVRVVAPREHRIRTIMERKDINAKLAAHEVDARDREREIFIQRTFNRSADDPLAYDVIVNAADAPPEEIADWLAVAARRKFQRIRVPQPQAA